MFDAITHVAFFGDAEHRFCLTDPMLAELEKITELGTGVLFFSMIPPAYPAEHLREIIRLGLIGGGMKPEGAKRLCDTYATNRPLAETLALAWEILNARWTGKAAPVVAPVATDKAVTA